MKNIFLAIVSIVMFGLMGVTVGGNWGGGMRAMGGVEVREAAGGAWFSCTCSCGKSCDGSCSSHYSGCSASAALSCAMACCEAAPSPGPGECYELIQ
jgi:hypothetical protein